MVRAENRLPKSLRDFLSSGKGSFEDDEAVFWDVELEPGNELPEIVQEEHPNAQIFANNGVGDLLFLIPQSGKESLDDRVFVFRHEGGKVEDLGTRLSKLLKPGRRGPSDHPAVYYFESGDPVQLGDRVELKLWIFLRRTGEVVYVPGVSPRKPSMERDGLAWVGVRLDSGDRVDTIVNPDIGRLQKDVRKLEC